MKTNHSEMRIDYTKKQIILSAGFAKKSRFPDTDEYNRLKAIREDFPDFAVSLRTINKPKSKETYKGLTYEYIENYIRSHENSEKMFAEYQNLKDIIACHNSHYPKVKKWFLNNYPEIKLEIDEAKTA